MRTSVAPGGRRVPIVFAGQSGPFAAAALRALLRMAGDGGGAPLRVVGVLEGPGAKVGPHRRRLWGLGAHLGKLPAARDTLDLEVLAAHLGLPHAFWSAPEAPDAALRLLRRCGARVAVCVGFPFLWPTRVLGTLDEALNVHPSALPRWRGPSPLFWWLRSGEAQTAVSVHGMVAAADAGPLWSRTPLAPPWRARGAELLALCGRAGARDVAALLGRSRPLWSALSGGASSWAPRPSARDACVRAEDWPSAALLRYAHGAPDLACPSLWLDGARHPLLGGVGWRPGARLPGRWLRQSGALWVQARDGVVGLEVGEPPQGDAGPR